MVFFGNCSKTFYLDDFSAVDKEYAVAHIFVGLFMVALGVWGLFEEYYFVIDFLKGFGPIVLIAGGLLATLAGCVPPKSEEGEAHGEN